MGKLRAGERATHPRTAEDIDFPPPRGAGPARAGGYLLPVIGKGEIAWEGSVHAGLDHFADVSKMVGLGAGGGLGIGGMMLMLLSKVVEFRYTPPSGDIDATISLEFRTFNQRPNHQMVQNQNSMNWIANFAWPASGVCNNW